MRQRFGRRIVIRQNQRRIRLAALHGDPHGHLSDRRTRQTRRSGQRLARQYDMHAKRPTLTNQPVQQHRAIGRQPVVTNEQLLKLVDDQHHPRHGRPGLIAVIAQRRRRSRPKRLAATLQFPVQRLQHAPAKLPFALDPDHPCVGQLGIGVPFQFHALFEIQQIELQLIGRIVIRTGRNDAVQQRRLSAASLAGDQDMLSHAVAEFQRQRPPRPLRTDRNRQPTPAVALSAKEDAIEDAGLPDRFAAG